MRQFLTELGAMFAGHAILRNEAIAFELETLMNISWLSKDMLDWDEYRRMYHQSA